LAAESPSEHEDSGLSFTSEQLESLRKLAARTFAISTPAHEQTEMQPWHRERGIQIGGGPVMIDGAANSALLLPTQSANVVRRCVMLVEPKEAGNDVVSSLDLAAVNQQHGLEQQRFSILARQSCLLADVMQRLRKPLLAQEIQRRCGVKWYG
jgi:hypothetical protein